MGNSMEFPQKIKSYNYHMAQQSHFCIYIQKKLNHYLEDIYALPCFIATLFAIAKYGNNLSGLCWIMNSQNIGGSVIKNPAANAGDSDSVPGLRRSPAEGSNNPLYISCLKDPMDRGPWQGTVHWIAKAGYNLMTKHHHQQQMYRCKIPTLKKENEILPIATT